MEEKINMKFAKFPLRIKQQSRLKKIFFDLIDDKATSVIAKKVSKMNGDVRVAFDIVKSAFVELYNQVKHCSNKPDEKTSDS